jgi:hypothetical protein
MAVGLSPPTTTLVCGGMHEPDGAVVRRAVVHRLVGPRVTCDLLLSTSWRGASIVIWSGLLSAAILAAAPAAVLDVHGEPTLSRRPS